MEAEKIARINQLKHLSTQRELTPDEHAEREALRQEYIQGFRKNMEEMLAGVQIKYPDGSVHPLKKKE